MSTKTNTRGDLSICDVGGRAGVLLFDGRKFYPAFSESEADEEDLIHTFGLVARLVHDQLGRTLTEQELRLVQAVTDTACNGGSYDDALDRLSELEQGGWLTLRDMVRFDA